MNPTPCPLCNHFHRLRLQAHLKREYKELERLEQEHEKHKETCEVLNSGWYKVLWGNVAVGGEE